MVSKEKNNFISVYYYRYFPQSLLQPYRNKQQ